MTVTRSDVVRMARSLLGTPFLHQGRQRPTEAHPGALDCAGLVVCVARELCLVAPDFDVTAYGRVPDGRSLLDHADAHMRRIRRAEMRPGDVMVVDWGQNPQHFCILGDYPGGGLSVIHAFSHADGKGSVIEANLDRVMQRQFVAAYALPGVV